MKKFWVPLILILTINCSDNRKKANYIQQDSTLLNYVLQINEDLKVKELSEIQCIVDGPKYQSGVRLFLRKPIDSTKYYDDFATAELKENRLKIHFGGCYGGMVGDAFDITIVDSIYYVEYTYWTDVGDFKHKPLLQRLVVNKSEFILGESIMGEFEFEGLNQSEKRGGGTSFNRRSSWKGYFQTEITLEEDTDTNKR
jgi:hypothetical protein